MTPEEFEALRPRLGRLAIDTIELARSVLVDGATQSEAALQHGMSRQRVHGIIQRFKAAAEELPTNWRRVEVWLPQALAADVEALAKQARADHSAKEGE